MKKILVITFAEDTNPGTYMQAFGVYTGLKKIFPEAIVEYLNFPNFKRLLTSNNKEVDNIIKVFVRKYYTLRRRIKYRKLRSMWYSPTKRIIDLFNYTTADTAYIKNNYDLVVIGSDTILEKAYSDSGIIGLNWLPIDVPKVYFAASASPAKFTPDSHLAQVAAAASYIGLRDHITLQLFKHGLKIPQTRLHHQPDPTYLLDYKGFSLPRRMSKRLTPCSKWAFCNFSPTFVYKAEVVGILRNKGYKIVSPEYNSDADVSLATVDAHQWAALFKYVDLVVTERFHDSVFALRACCPVINLDWETYRIDNDGNSKTLSILKDYGLERFHLTISSAEDIKPIGALIDDLEQTFNTTYIKAVNDKLCDEAYRLLDLMKMSLSNG